MNSVHAENLPPDRAAIATEHRNRRSVGLHAMGVRACVDLINSENRAVLDAMEGAAGTLAELIERAEPGFARGGRLVYLGAGTSGRLGVLDASEAPPTFQVEPGRVVGVIAGGDAALKRSSESLEDEPDGAAPDLAALALTKDDTVIGLAAGGTTPFVLGGLAAAKRLAPGCVTGLVCCTPIEQPAHADVLVVLQTGAEIVTGSTRMKAGTATKLAINTISTTLMVRTGRVYQNLMVDLRATNAKLMDRAARIVGELTDLDRPACFALLERSDRSVKHAVVMHRLGVDLAEAGRLLDAVGGRLADVIDR
jgi:N-acetylmuramic acid 6-phosphate etherase